MKLSTLLAPAVLALAACTDTVAPPRGDPLRPSGRPAAALLDGGTRYATEWSEFTTGAAPTDWTPVWDRSSPDRFLVQGSAAAADGVVLQWNGVGLPGGARHGLAYTGFGNVTDQEVFGRFRVASTRAGNHGLLALRMGGTATDERGYRLSLSDQNAVLSSYENGGYQQIATVPFAWTQGAWINARMRMTGTTLLGRIWPANQPEPATWNIAHPNTHRMLKFYPSGLPGLVTHDRALVEWDFWSAAVGGASAPVSLGPHADGDGDGVTDPMDNCAEVANPQQADADADGAGDACDPDLDNDTVPNGADNCPLAMNAAQADADGDGVGNACDPDHVPPPPATQYATGWQDLPLGQAPAGWAPTWDRSVPDRFLVQASADAPDGRVLQWDGTTLASPARYGLAYTGFGNVSDQEVFARFRVVTGSAGNLGLVAVRMGGTATDERGYRMALNSQAVILCSYENGGYQQISSAPFAWTRGAWISVRLRMTGAVLRGKIWLSSQPEPAEWNIPPNDTHRMLKFYPGGMPGLVTHDVRTLVEWDYWSAAVGGASAPAP